MKCSRRVPIKRYAHVVATDGGRVYFRGYVKKPKIVNMQSRELSCMGEEDLLLRRYSGRYSYQASTHYLGHVFQSDPPSQAADGYGVTGSVGMLFMANSVIPYHGSVTVAGSPAPHFDWDAAGVDWIYRLPGLGLNSRIGSADIYAEGTLLPRVDSYAELETTDISCFSDADDLHIRLDNSVLNRGFGPRMCIMAENAYDTGVRMGNIDLQNTLLTGNLQLAFDRMLDIINNIAEFYGLNPRFRRTRDHTYFDALDEPVENEFTITEESIADLTQEYSDDNQVHALTGKGYGSRDVQHVYTPSDHTWKGVWLEETIDVDEGFVDSAGNLKAYVDAEYGYRQADEMFTVVPVPSWTGRPRPNDVIRLQLVGESEKLLQVASATLKSTGRYEMEIGGRSPDIIDAFAGRDALNSIYLNEYLVEYGKVIDGSGEDFQIGDTTHGLCTGGTFSFTLPTDVYESDLSHRVTLDISITTDQSPVSCVVMIRVNGGYNIFCQPNHYLLGDQITGLDITSYCNYGSATTVDVWVIKNGEWSGASCAAHPTMDISYTLRCWKRTIQGSTVERGLNKQAVKYTSWQNLKYQLSKS